MVGERLGSYLIVKERGTGAMGVVYEAIHEEIGRRAAIKVLHPKVSSDPELAARFKNEARAVNLVRHPGVVSVYETGRLPSGSLYLVMELIEGETLGQALGRVGRLGLVEILHLGRGLSSIVAAAHKGGVVHRDLKPDNIMVVPDPDALSGQRFKVLDFGISKVLTQQTRVGPDQHTVLRTASGQILGTPAYMAPEQCRSDGDVGPPADVYALGATLYHAASGRPPFETQDNFEVMVKHLRDPVPPLRTLRPDAPPALAELIEEMLGKDVQLRPSMEQVATRCQELLLQTARLPPPASPRRWVLPAVTLVCVGACAALWSLTPRTGSEQKPRPQAPAPGSLPLARSASPATAAPATVAEHAAPEPAKRQPEATAPPASPPVAPLRQATGPDPRRSRPRAQPPGGEKNQDPFRGKLLD